MSMDIYEDSINNPSINPLTERPYSRNYYKLRDGVAPDFRGWGKFSSQVNKQDFLDKLEKTNIILLTGETGSGKTTQIPKILFEYLDYAETVLCTQPRRVTTSLIAKRVAEEMDVELGDHVGFRYQGSEIETGGDIIGLNKLYYMTDGTFASFVLPNPSTLADYGAIIIDEAHVRNEAIDTLLYLIRRVLRLIPQARTKFIIMSATVDKDIFMNYYKKEGIVHHHLAGATQYPIKDIYLDRSIYEGTKMPLMHVPWHLKRIVGDIYGIQWRKPKPQSDRKRDFRQNNQRDFQKNRQEKREDGRDNRRDFGKDQQNRRDFGKNQQNQRDFRKNQQNRIDFGKNQQNRRDFGKNRQNRRDFGKDQQNQRDFQNNRQNRRDFVGDQQNRRDFGKDQQNRREFGKDQQNRRDFGKDQQNRRDFRKGQPNKEDLKISEERVIEINLKDEGNKKDENESDLQKDNRSLERKEIDRKRQERIDFFKKKLMREVSDDYKPVLDDKPTLIEESPDQTLVEKMVESEERFEKKDDQIEQKGEGIYQIDVYEGSWSGEEMYGEENEDSSSSSSSSSSSYSSSDDEENEESYTYEDNVEELLEDYLEQLGGKVDNTKLNKLKKPEGDILVFLPTIRALTDFGKVISSFLDEHGVKNYKTMAVSGRSTEKEKDQAQKAIPGVTKIVFATDVAETGITIENLSYVIDTGIKNQVEYDVTLRATRSGIEFTSKAAVRQRRGRTGRRQAGICYHLYTEDEFKDQFPSHPKPDILSNKIDGLILKLLFETRGEKSGISMVRKMLNEFLTPVPKTILDIYFSHFKNRKWLSAQTGHMTELGECIITSGFRNNLDLAHAFLLYEVYNLEPPVLADLTMMMEISNRMDIKDYLKPGKEGLPEEFKQKYLNKYGDLIGLYHVYLDYQARKLPRKYHEFVDIEKFKELYEASNQLLLSPIVENMICLDSQKPKFKVDEDDLYRNYVSVLHQAFEENVVEGEEIKLNPRYDVSLIEGGIESKRKYFFLEKSIRTQFGKELRRNYSMLFPVEEKNTKSKK